MMGERAIAESATTAPSERETALEAELAEVRARVKVLSSLGSGPHPQLRALDEALARATSAEASAREAWKAGDELAANMRRYIHDSKPERRSHFIERYEFIRAKVGV